jgi:DNA-binding CsgD family transcriptional regulator
MDNQLTKQEVIVLANLAQGLSRDETADKIGCKRSNINKHLQNIYRKFDDNDLTMVLIKTGFIRPSRQAKQTAAGT